METREIKLSIERATQWANGSAKEFFTNFKEDIEIYFNY